LGPPIDSADATTGKVARLAARKANPQKVVILAVSRFLILNSSLLTLQFVDTIAKSEYYPRLGITLLSCKKSRRSELSQLVHKRCENYKARKMLSLRFLG
jgi:hypothetical protein